jgi:hypothetical protein
MNLINIAFVLGKYVLPASGKHSPEMTTLAILERGKVLKTPLSQ